MEEREGQAKARLFLSQGRRKVICRQKPTGGPRTRVGCDYISPTRLGWFNRGGVLWQRVKASGKANNKKKSPKTP